MRVSELQKGNALIKHIRRIPIEYKYLIYDYEPGEHFGIIHMTLQLFISSPKYLFSRVEKIKAAESKRAPILLLLVNADIATPMAAAAFASLQIDCLSVGVQMLPAHSPMECARYIENMHMQETAPCALRNYKGHLARAIKQTPGISTEEKARKFLFVTAIAKISRTDGLSLLSTRSIRDIAEESRTGRLSAQKGIGRAKEREMAEFFMQKFN